MVIFEIILEVQRPEAFFFSLLSGITVVSFPFSTMHITCSLWLKVKELKSLLSLAVGW